MKNKIKKFLKNIYLDLGGWIGSRYIYRELLLPFLFSISVVTFVLLVNFLIREIDALLGKNISWGVVLQFLGLNLMHIIALSVPMAVLVACIMTYGRLSEDNEITAMRSSGISFFSILRPGIIFGAIITIGMVFFQNNVLPHTNYKARLLEADIKQMRPDLSVQPGYFMDDLDQYSIYVKSKDKQLLKDITIYNKNPEEKQQTIFADSGRIEIKGSKLLFHLFSGEIHELKQKQKEEYQIIKFKRHQFAIPVDNLTLQRSKKGRRGDREMTIGMMKKEVNKYKNRMDTVEKNIKKLVAKRLEIAPTIKYKKIKKEINRLIQLKKERFSSENFRPERRKLNSLKSRIRSKINLYQSYKEQVYKFQVEINKKYSLPLACLVFVLIGGPLGIMTRKGGMAMASVISLVFFIVYYIFLVGGEELANRTLITPFWGMWTPNLILGLSGGILIYMTEKDRKTFNFTFIKKLFNKEDSEVEE